MEILLPVLLFAAIGILLGTMVLAAHRHAQRLVRAWAAREGLRLEKCERHLAGDGPFAWTPTTQIIWRIRVTQADGGVRDGWVRSGLTPGAVDVHWAEPGQSAFR